MTALTALTQVICHRSVAQKCWFNHRCVSAERLKVCYVEPGHNERVCFSFRSVSLARTRVRRFAKLHWRPLPRHFAVSQFVLRRRNKCREYQSVNSHAVARTGVKGAPREAALTTVGFSLHHGP